MTQDFEALILAENSPLLLSQVDIKSVCDEMLKARRVNGQLSFTTFVSTLDPRDVQGRLRAGGLSDLMLRDGDSLSFLSNGDYYEELGVFVEDANLIAVELRVWEWEFDKCRINPRGPSRPPYEVLTYPEEKDWTRRLDVRLWYAGSGQEVAQEVGVTTSSARAEMPYFERNVVAPAYAETGYEGHSSMWRAANDEAEVSNFLALARDLFAARRTDVAELLETPRGVRSQLRTD